MKIAVFICLLACVSCAVGGCLHVEPHKSKVQEEGISHEMEQNARLEDLPDHFSYRCEAMVNVVNHLRHLGKEKATETLLEYSRTHPKEDAQENVVLVCRLLFVPPKGGWSRETKDLAHLGSIEMLGVPEPRLSQEADTTGFPLFPIVLSRGVPFLVVRSYGGVDLGGEYAGEACLRMCADLPLISHDLPAKEYANAAEDLLYSSPFNKLYEGYPFSTGSEPNPLLEVEEFIWMQAMPWQPPVPKQHSQ